MATVRQNGPTSEIVCDTAGEFLAVLDPLLGPFAQPAHLDMYMFRGVSSATYELRPSAHRPDATMYDGAKWIHPPLNTVGEQCGVEIETLRKFFEIAARNGIRLPEDSQALRTELDSWPGRLYHATADAPVFWPPSSLLSLLALAQHHGVPTRALDWTWSSLTAAYFAVSGTRTDQNDYVVVWTYSYLSEVLERITTWLKPEGCSRPLIVFTAPGAENDNLQAQRGMFMAHVQRVEDRESTFAAEAYEILLAQTTAASRYYPTVYRVMVPSTESPEIRWYLSAAGYTAGRLFPGLWGVAREFNEERLISRRAAGLPATRFSSNLQSKIKRVHQEWRRLTRT